jgi:glycerophosphoryl diester phosphodiesterase
VLLDLAARPVIGHRGASAYAPENTLPSFAVAAEQGADAVECDVHVTADGVPVVIHDPTLDRTTDLVGAVAATPFARLREADAGARFTADGGRIFPFRGRGVRVPTLAEVLDAVPAALPLVIEIKTPRAQHAVRDVLLERDAATRCVVASFHDAALDAFRAPPFTRAASRPEVARVLLEATLGLPAPPARCHAVMPPLRHWGLLVPTVRFVAAARRRGCPVHVWTVDDAATARLLWRNGVSGIVTNCPDVILRARESGVADR